MEQHAASALQGAGAQQHVPCAVLPPDLGIAHVVGAVGGVSLVAQHQPLGTGVKVDAVVAGHEDLVLRPARS